MDEGTRSNTALGQVARRILKPICCVSRKSEGLGRAQVLTKLSAAVSAGWSAKERTSRAWGEGEGGEAPSVVFYEGLRLWEAHLYVFYMSGRLSGGSTSNQLVRKGGSAKERPSRAWGVG